MSKYYTYYSIGYNYQRASEWFAGSEKEALTAFLTESSENPTSRVRVVAESYVVNDDDKNYEKHVCERGCAFHFVSKNEWIYKGWQTPKIMRKLASKIS
jgi:hypothetical protein